MCWTVPNTVYWQVEVSETKFPCGIFSKLAGTVFLLALVAVAKLKARVCDSGLTHEFVQWIKYLLRVPAWGVYESRFLNGNLLTYVWARLRFR